jgi:hypothetical protein
MKIEFSKEEYSSLMDIIIMADWIMHTTHEYNEILNHTKLREYEMLNQKLMSYYEEFECQHKVEYLERRKEFGATQKYIDSGEYRYFLYEFSEGTFWVKLAWKLAERDYLWDMGTIKYNLMNEADRIIAIRDVAEKYLKAFQEDGINDVIKCDSPSELFEDMEREMDELRSGPIN